MTCGLERMPTALVEQTRPGGGIVFPWSPAPHAGYKIRLDVLGDGLAVGRIHGSAGYMMMRSQRRNATWHAHHTTGSTTYDIGPGARAKGSRSKYSGQGTRPRRQSSRVSILLASTGYPAARFACTNTAGIRFCASAYATAVSHSATAVLESASEAGRSV